MPTVPLVLREYDWPATLEDHQIDSAGLVTPSLLCPNRCGFHDYVALINLEAACSTLF